MSSEVSINICKILNWCLTNSNIKLEVAFYTLKSRNYLAHKSAIGYFNCQTLTLNTSFRINYHTSEHIIVCRISDLRDKANIQVVGQIEIDLNLLAERKALFIPFQDHDKVLQIRIYEPKKDNIESQKSITDNTQQRREQFLQERFDFLDKLTEHQTQLKKKFSQKVYNLLKQLKNKNHQSKNDQAHKSHIEKQSKSKNELQFRNRLGQQKKKNQFYLEARNTKISPAKNKFDHELLIHSVHAKPQHKIEPIQQPRLKTADSPNHIKSQANNPAFGGIINHLNHHQNY